MARTTSTNFTGANSFTKASADSDAFDAADVQQLAAAVDAHDHSTGKGLAVSGGGGGGSGVAVIAKTVLTASTSGATAFDFTSIPGTYTCLVLRGWLRGDYSGQFVINVQLNGDTNTSHYYSTPAAGAGQRMA